MIRLQRTIKRPASITGIGLHTGKSVNMTIRPAAPGGGITFVRTDLDGRKVRATAENTAATGYATTLVEDGAEVRTVEHVLAAFSALGIDNVLVELDSDEAPIMDGSAAPFVRLIVEAGVQVQNSTMPVIKIIKPVFVREGHKQIALWPSENAAISYFIDFDHPMLREQSLHFPVTEEGFMREIADARTFGFMSDVQSLRSNGLAKGASMENAVALSETSVLNKEGLRYKDEFVRHKILDLIGDLSLAGMPIIGHVVAHKSGHSLNAQLVSKLLASPESWMVIGAAEPVERHGAGEYQYQATL